MIVVGLTGSIAMGKSTVAAIFAFEGYPVFDADVAVREFYQSDGVDPVEAAFPGVAVQGVVNREELGARVLGSVAAMRRLEEIVHPAVAERRNHFLDRARRTGQRVAFLDIPLLFEAGGEGDLGVVVVVSASPESQSARAFARKGMTQTKFDSIRARQTSDLEKRRRAHFVIDTNGTIEESREQAKGLLRAILGLPGGEPNA